MAPLAKPTTAPDYPQAAGPCSALAGLEAADELVDDVKAAIAANQAVAAVPAGQGLERIADLHGVVSIEWVFGGAT
jgi:hypothetical protein